LLLHCNQRLCFFIAGSTPRRRCSRIGEKIFMCPIIDSSSLDKFEGWPSEKPLQMLLQKNYQQMYHTMFVEFRRGEKYGLYEMVEDSSQSTVLFPLSSNTTHLKKDTLTLPVRLSIRQGSVKKNFPELFTAYGIYKAQSRPKARFITSTFFWPIFAATSRISAWSVFFAPHRERTDPARRAFGTAARNRFIYQPGRHE